MPRAQTSKAGGKLKTVIAFFKEASMEIAELGLDMAREALRDRHKLAEKIRAGQAKAKPPVAAKPPKAKAKAKHKAAAATVAPPAPKVRKRERRSKPRHQVPEALPEQDLLTDDLPPDAIEDNVNGEQL